MTRRTMVWIALAIWTLGLIIVAVFWVRPVYREIHDTLVDIDSADGRLRNWHSMLAKLPNEQTIKNQEEYRRWLDEQAAIVLAYFRKRDELLETYIVSSPETTKPEEFKLRFIDRIDAMNQWAARLKREKGISLPENLFPRPPWYEKGGLPQPGEYKRVSNELCVTAYILQVLQEAGAKEVKEIAVGATERKSELVSLIPVRCTATLPPERLPKLLVRLLQVREEDTTSLCLLMESLALKTAEISGEKPAGTGPLVTISLQLQVVDVFLPPQEPPKPEASSSTVN